MGTSSSARCDSSVAAISGCQTACSQCNVGGVDKAGRQRSLCSWAEEEVSLPGRDPMVGLDYGYLGARPACASDDTFRMALSAKALVQPLFDPGGLVPVRGLGEDGNGEGQPVNDVYMFDTQKLGRGSYGEVTGATHVRTGARRAVKTVGKSGLRKYVNNVSGFVRREVDILRRLDHPNIVRLYDAFEDEATIYLVLEICEGGDLLERVTVARERLPEREAAVLLSQMLGAIQHLYLRGIVHRDLKPENFLFTRREPEREPLPPEVAPVKLIDFGLSRRLSFEAGMRITPKIGTTEYMAPEAYAGRVKAVLADRTDMWSIGVVLHIIFIGHFPSPRLAEQTPEEYLSLPCWNKISPMGRDLLGQMLRQDPSQRPTVTVALKHPWLAPAFDPTSVKSLHGMPAAIKRFSGTHDLHRIALMAAAREVDDCDAWAIRRLHQMLELECDGALTRPALERASWLPGPAGATAAELARCFDTVDVDGSGTLDWTELVAVAFNAERQCSSDPAALKALKGRFDSSNDATNPSPRVLLLRNETCWRAFDLLSQGTSSVTSHTLAQLLGPHEADTWAQGLATSGGTGGSLDVRLADSRSSRHAELHRIVQEVNPENSINATRFIKLLQSG